MRVLDRLAATYRLPTAAFFRWVLHRRKALATMARAQTRMEPSWSSVHWAQDGRVGTDPGCAACRLLLPRSRPDRSPPIRCLFVWLLGQRAVMRQGG